MYNDIIIERFKNPKFSGEIENADGIGEEGNVKCGDIMRVYIKINEKDKDGNLIENVDERIVENIKFKTYGCVAAIASSDVLCEIALGKSLKESSSLTAQDVVKAMGGDVPPAKVHCSVLAHEALNAAINDYKEKLKNEQKK